LKRQGGDVGEGQGGQAGTSVDFDRLDYVVLQPVSVTASLSRRLNLTCIDTIGVHQHFSEGFGCCERDQVWKICRKIQVFLGMAEFL